LIGTGIGHPLLSAFKTGTDPEAGVEKHNHGSDLMFVAKSDKILKVLKKAFRIVLIDFGLEEDSSSLSITAELYSSH
jgi:hypothetical protein